MPTATDADRLAARAWKYLADGNGGIQWAGLPYVAAHLGITDPADLMDRLYVLKTHKPKKD